MVGRDEEYDFLDGIYDNGICQCRSNRWFYGIPVATIGITILDITIFHTAPDLVYEWAIHLPPRSTEGWHLLSSMLIHFDTAHLYGNMVVQLVVGTLLEFYHGPIRVLVIYTCAGVVGGASEALLTTRVPINIAGASGAIYGILGAFGANLFFNWNEQPCPLLLLLVYIGYFAFDIVNSFTVDSTSVALWAHYAGALSGFLFAMAVARNIRIERYEAIVRLVAIIADIVLLATIILYTLISWRHP